MRVHYFQKGDRVKMLEAGPYKGLKGVIVGVGEGLRREVSELTWGEYIKEDICKVKWDDTIYGSSITTTVFLDRLIEEV